MRKTIYLKFILAYALFAFFGFVTVATFVSRLTYEYCQRQTSPSTARDRLPRTCIMKRPG